MNNSRKNKPVNPVRGYGPLDKMLARLRHGIAYRKLKAYGPLDSCLDIGSGAYPAFLSQLPARQKVGLEQQVSAESAQLASSMQIRLVECSLHDAAPLPFEDDTFHAVTMLAVIEHIEPACVPFLLSEVCRVLRPSGVFMLTTPAAWTDPLLRTLAACRLVSRQEIEDHKDTFTRGKLRTLLADAGFQNIRAGTFECLMNLWAVAEKQPLV